MKYTVITAAVIAMTAMVAAPVQADVSVSAAINAFLAGQAGLLGPTQTGQPGASCEDTPTPPGDSSSAPGSAFNPDGKSGTVYAGEQPQNQRNTASVSQYDVACVKQPF